MLQSPDLFRTLLDHLHEGVYFLDPQRRIQYWNRAAERITGYTCKEVEGTCCADNILMHVDDDGNLLCKSECPVSASLRDGAERQVRVFLHHKDGHRVPVHVSVAVIRDEKGETIGALETFHDDTPTLAALREVEAAQETPLICALTGVGNRRLSERALAQRLDEMRHADSRLALMLVDIDGLKAVNDAYGRPVGDVVLKMVARTLHNALRPYDFIGRWAGEEFAVIAPNIRPIQLLPVAERLRRLVEMSSREVSNRNVTVTVSIGGCLSNEDDYVESIAARAERRLFEAKAAGRNRVSVDTE